MAKYFVKNAGCQPTKTPVTPFEILSWVVAEQLSKGWQVWKEGGKVWQDPTNVSELKWIFFFEGLFGRLGGLVEELEGKLKTQTAENAELRQMVTSFEQRLNIIVTERPDGFEVQTMIQRELENRIKTVDAETERKNKVEEIKATILHDFAQDLDKLPSEVRSRLIRRAKGLGYKVVDDKMSVDDAKLEFADEIHAEIRKAAPPETPNPPEGESDELPTGGKRVVEYLMNTDATLTREDAVANALNAFRAIGEVNVESAIKWLGRPKLDVSEPSEGVLSFDNPDEVSEMVAKILGYDQLKDAKKKKAIKELASEFASREASERTEEILVKVISAAVESDQLRRKE